MTTIWPPFPGFTEDLANQDLCVLECQATNYSFTEDELEEVICPLFGRIFRDDELRRNTPPSPWVYFLVALFAVPFLLRLFALLHRSPLLQAARAGYAATFGNDTKDPTTTTSSSTDGDDEEEEQQQQQRFAKMHQDLPYTARRRTTRRGLSSHGAPKRKNTAPPAMRRISGLAMPPAPRTAFGGRFSAVAEGGEDMELRAPQHSVVVEGLDGTASTTTMARRPRPPMRAGFDVKIDNLCYFVETKKSKKNGDPPKQLLQNVSAVFKKGQVHAIMGASGAGKTTLLEIMARRRAEGFITGDIIYDTVSAEEASEEWMSTNTGYLRQLGVTSIPTLTAWENLCFAAELRIGGSDRALRRVKDVAHKLGMQSFLDVVVGDDNSGAGLSGGQKRKLAVAIELLKDPPILFLDELTSGLDAHTSLDVLLHLHALAQDGKTIILTIHQPRLEIWAVLDSVVFMAASPGGGKLACTGPPDDCVRFFAEVLGKDCDLENAANPADTIMDCLAVAEFGTLLHQTFKKTSQAGEIESQLQMTRATRAAAKGQSLERQVQPEYAPASLLQSFVAIDTRYSTSRSWVAPFVPGLTLTAAALVVGTIQLQTTTAIKQTSAAFLMLAVSQMFSDMLCSPELLKVHLPLLRDEADAGAVRPWMVIMQYYAANACFLVGGSVPMALAAYYLVVRPDQQTATAVIEFLAILAVHSACWLSVSVMVAGALSDFGAAFQRARTVIVLILVASAFLGGFIVPANDLPVYYSWILVINPVWYGLQGMLSALIDGARFDCAPISVNLCNSFETLEFIGESDPDIDLALMALVIFTLGLVVLTAVLTQKKIDSRLASFRQQHRRAHHPHALRPHSSTVTPAGTLGMDAGKKAARFGMVRFRGEGRLLALTEQAGRWQMAFHLVRTLRQQGLLGNLSALGPGQTIDLSDGTLVDARWSLVCAQFLRSVGASRAVHRRRRGILAAIQGYRHGSRSEGAASAAAMAPAPSGSGTATPGEVAVVTEL